MHQVSAVELEVTPCTMMLHLAKGHTLLKIRCLLTQGKSCSFKPFDEYWPYIVLCTYSGACCNSTKCLLLKVKCCLLHLLDKCCAGQLSQCSVVCFVCLRKASCRVCSFILLWYLFFDFSHQHQQLERLVSKISSLFRVGRTGFRHQPESGHFSKTGWNLALAKICGCLVSAGFENNAQPPRLTFHKFNSKLVTDNEKEQLFYVCDRCAHCVSCYKVPECAG